MASHLQKAITWTGIAMAFGLVYIKELDFGTLDLEFCLKKVPFSLIK